MSATHDVVYSLRVLVVDDTATNRQILALFLRKIGHVVDMAVDGAEAVRMFTTHRYDIIFMDVMMPVMDGYEATRRIKAISTERWVPVIFLSALDKDENLVAGLEAGGDDYLSKPVNFIVLEAKLRSLTRTLLLRRELDETRLSLQRYHDEREAENALAAGILEQVMQRPGLRDPHLSYWMAPVSEFSGDIIAATRAVNGRLYLLLADATGHGLAAAISVLPLLTQFYDSAGAGVAISRIISRINTQLHASLPVGRFVAATFVCLDENTACTDIWLGGLPPALVMGPKGEIVHRISPFHLPLGIDDGTPDIGKTERLCGTYPPGSQLVLFSDGLLEAANAAGEIFGLPRLVAVLASVPPKQRVEAVKEAVYRHLGAETAHDDITLALVDLPIPHGITSHAAD